MINRLTPDQISRYWDIIRYAVEQSLPPIVYDHPDKMNRILTALLSGKAQCWAVYEKEDKRIKLEVIIITRIIFDDVSSTNNLLIYCMYGYRSIRLEKWAKHLVSLAKYASSRNCSQIVAYVSNPDVTSVVRRLGGNADYTFISFSTDSTINELGK